MKYKDYFLFWLMVDSIVGFIFGGLIVYSYLFIINSLYLFPIYLIGIIIAIIMTTIQRRNLFLRSKNGK